MFVFRIDTHSGVPPYLQLVQQVRQAVLLGFLQPGDRLPLIREVVEDLAINPNTVAKAYAELTTEGWLESRQGLGLYVAPPRQRLSTNEREKRMDEAVSRFVHDVIALDYTADEAVARIDLELRAFAPRKTA